jgi:hypothetical protein
MAAMSRTNRAWCPGLSPLQLALAAPILKVFAFGVRPPEGGLSMRLARVPDGQ